MDNPLLKPLQTKYQDKIYILIELFIKKPCNWDDKKFKQEMVAFAKLVKSYPDFDFFYNLPEYSNRFNSFWGFQIARVKNEMSKKYANFCAEKERNKAYILQDNPVIKIDKIEKKSQNILEFLNEK